MSASSFKNGLKLLGRRSSLSLMMAAGLWCSDRGLWCRRWLSALLASHWDSGLTLSLSAALAGGCPDGRRRTTSTAKTGPSSLSGDVTREAASLPLRSSTKPALLDRRNVLGDGVAEQGVAKAALTAGGRRRGGGTGMAASAAGGEDGREPVGDVGVSNDRTCAAASSVSASSVCTPSTNCCCCCFSCFSFLLRSTSADGGGGLGGGGPCFFSLGWEGKEGKRGEGKKKMRKVKVSAAKGKELGH